MLSNLLLRMEDVNYTEKGDQEWQDKMLDERKSSFSNRDSDVDVSVRK